MYDLKHVLFHEGSVQEDSCGGEGGELTLRDTGAPASHQPQEGSAVP